MYIVLDITPNIHCYRGAGPNGPGCFMFNLYPRPVIAITTVLAKVPPCNSFQGYLYIYMDMYIYMLIDRGFKVTVYIVDHFKGSIVI